MVRKAPAVVALMVALLGAAGVCAASEAEIRVGVSAPITGPAPMEGQFMRNAVELAVREANASGGVLGLPVRMVVYDDQHSPTLAVNVVNRLLFEDDVHVQIGPHRSVTAASVEPVLKRRPVPLLTGATSPQLAGLGNPYLFRVRADDGMMARIAAKYVVEKMGARRIGIFYNNDDYGKDAAREIEKALKETYDLEPVARQSHNTGDKDMTSQLLQFSRLRAEVVIVWTHVPEAAVLTRQWRELGLDRQFKLFGSSTFSAKPWYDLVGEQADGILSVTYFVASNPDPIVQEWVAKFRSTWGAEPELMACAYYDAAKLALEAIRRAGSLQPEAVRNALASIRGYRGVTSTYTCDRYGGCSHQALVVVMKGSVPQALDVTAVEPQL